MTSGCYVHCSAMDIYMIIYPVVHVFKDQILGTNTVDFGWSFYCAQYLNISSPNFKKETYQEGAPHSL